MNGSFLPSGPVTVGRKGISLTTMDFHMASQVAAANASGAAYVAQAIRASGVLVKVTPDEFQKILVRAERPLVIYNRGGFLSTRHRYLLHYRGFAFYTSSPDALNLPGTAEIIPAGRIWIP